MTKKELIEFLISTNLPDETEVKVVHTEYDDYTCFDVEEPIYMVQAYQASYKQPGWIEIIT